MHPWAHERFGAARVARLATVSEAGSPHLVPVVFALVGGNVWIVIDAKPKSTRRLKRLANIAAHPSVSLLVDHYEDDWHQLWWVRADGVATVLPIDAPEAGSGLSALHAKYEQYQADPPDGPLIRIAIATWRSWAADDPAPRT